MHAHVRVRACVRAHVRACVRTTQKNFWPKKFFLTKIFFLQKPQKNFLTKKIFFSPKNYWTKKKLSKKPKHKLSLNIDHIKTSTVPASDIPWRPLNIDRAAWPGPKGQLVFDCSFDLIILHNILNAINSSNRRNWIKELDQGIGNPGPPKNKKWSLRGC